MPQQPGKLEDGGTNPKVEHERTAGAVEQSGWLDGEQLQHLLTGVLLRLGAKSKSCAETGQIFEPT